MCNEYEQQGLLINIYVLLGHHRSSVCYFCSVAVLFVAAAASKNKPYGIYKLTYWPSTSTAYCYVHRYLFITCYARDSGIFAFLLLLAWEREII